MKKGNRKIFSIQWSGVSVRHQECRRGTVCSVVKTILICLLGGFAVAPTLGDSRIDADGVLHVDGQRRFPLGLYQHVAAADLGKTLAAAGFHLMKCDANRDHLDHVKAAGALTVSAAVSLAGHATRSSGASLLRAYFSLPLWSPE